MKKTYEIVKFENGKYGVISISSYMSKRKISYIDCDINSLCEWSQSNYQYCMCNENKAIEIYKLCCGPVYKIVTGELL